MLVGTLMVFAMFPKRSFDGMLDNLLIFCKNCQMENVRVDVNVFIGQIMDD